MAGRRTCEDLGEIEYVREFREAGLSLALVAFVFIFYDSHVALGGL